ncbi:PEP-CTERM sorting domain-containing protein [Desulfobacula sp.]|uniref:PEP-CTERM sorting domain-containing protein n=1 Tax=Desulfobacula sp. TaxID=2593537 RepID=UPI00262C376C|nr:PEP-CTERM sorting domain-containing protein [Desulfobacula sp.]
MKKLLLLLIVLLLTWGLTGSAGASTIIQNPSFEDTPAMDEWTITAANGGTAQLYDSNDAWTIGTQSQKYTPTNLTYYAGLMETVTISQAIDWNAGTKLSFDYAWINNGGQNPDNAWLYVTGEPNVQLAIGTNIASVGDGTWTPYTKTFSSAITGFLTFGSLGTDDSLRSALLLDNISVISPQPVPDPDPAAAVPEPATVILFGLGLLGVAGVSRKKTS